MLLLFFLPAVGMGAQQSNRWEAWSGDWLSEDLTQLLRVRGDGELRIYHFKLPGPAQEGQGNGDEGLLPVYKEPMVLYGKSADENEAAWGDTTGRKIVARRHRDTGLTIAERVSLELATDFNRTEAGKHDKWLQWADDFDVVKAEVQLQLRILSAVPSGKLSRQPQVRFQPSPVYPFMMRRAGIEGKVVMDVVIGLEGSVLSANVVESSHKEFESPAVQAMRKAKFKPGEYNGKTVDTIVRQVVEFKMN